MLPIHIEHEGYLFTTDSSLLKPEQIHQWLSTKSYWCEKISYQIFKTAFDHSYSLGVLYGTNQVAYARFVTDYATFAYLADVYVLEEHRGKGISKKMMDILMNLDWVKQLRRLSLVTLDAHTLYEGFGFTAIAKPERHMELTRPDIYKTLAGPQA